VSRVAIVVVRYGEAITGGAEAHARQVAHRLAARHEVTVLTTCAEDYVTWADSDALPSGESQDGPVRVLRFKVRQPRDLQRWEASMQPLLQGIWDDEDEQAILREQGPDVPELLDHLRQRGRAYDAVIFFTLLYAPTVLGIPLVSDRAILVPTLHDEKAAHLDAQARAIRLAREVMWNTPEERELAQRLYDVDDLPGAICGVDIEPPADLQPDRARARFGLQRPYLLYAGRIDVEKSCGEMLDFFASWSRIDDRADLVLAGRAWMDIPQSPRIRHLGFVDTADLWDLYAGAVATVVPSRRESLSLLALESMAAGTPLLATAGSPVLEGHIRRSAAGLLYRDEWEFAAAASLLLDRPDTAAALGRDGRRYVAANFTWERIDQLYESAIARVAAGTMAALR
jgi:glycosyltransferase involved in cell wall biosynthesis